MSMQFPLSYQLGDDQWPFAYLLSDGGHMSGYGERIILYANQPQGTERSLTVTRAQIRKRRISGTCQAPPSPSRFLM